jgi:asparagine synthase (glutamine-hydrolysing)
VSVTLGIPAAAAVPELWRQNMSGFALVSDKSGRRPLSEMLGAIQHRGALVQSRCHGHIEWGILNRSSNAHFKADLGGSQKISVLVEGWIEGAGEFVQRQGCTTLPDAIAESVHREGVQALTRLRGAFVIVLIDLTSMQISVYRDTQGLRPVYFFSDGNVFVAASEVKAVLAHPATPRRVDTTVLSQLLVNGLEPADRSLALGVNKVLPGHLLEFEEGSAVRSRLLATPFVPMRKISIREAERELQGHLQDGLRQRVSDIESVGVLLSGGVDSYLVALALKEIDAPVRSATAGVVGDPENEIALAREAAQHLGIPHDAHEVSANDDLLDLLRKAVTATEQPGRYANALLLVHSFEQWRDGPTAVGCGECADVLFGGYEHRVMQRAALLRWVFRSDRALQLLSRLANRFGEGRGDVFDAALLSPRDFRFYIAEVFEYDRVSRLMGVDPFEIIARDFGTIWDEVDGESDVPDLQKGIYVDLRTSTQTVIDKLEKIGANAGRDVLHPFLMPSVVELALALPVSRKFSNGQDKVVPSGIAHRSFARLPRGTKIGFSVPRRRWLSTNPGLRQSVDALADARARIGDYVDRQELKFMVQEFRNSGGTRFSDSLWILTSAELWCEGMGI